MEQHYFFVAKLLDFLAVSLKNAIFTDIFSTSKSDIYFHLKTQNAWLNIRMQFTDYNSFISFPSFISIPTKNKFIQFKSLAGKKITEINQIPNDRIIYLKTDHDDFLILKFFGRNANIIYQEKDQPNEIFRKHIESDSNFSLNNLNLEAPINWEKITNWLPDYEKIQAKSIQFSPDLIINSAWFIHKFNNEYHLSFIKGSKEIIGSPYLDFAELLNDFHKLESSRYFFDLEKTNKIRQVQDQIKYYTKSLDNARTRIEKIKNKIPNEEIGHIIMANLHTFSKGLKSISLFDFYRNQNIEIKLDPAKDAQENAKIYYQKAKKEGMELEFAQLALADIENKIIQLNSILVQLQNTIDYKSLKNIEIPKKKNIEKQESKPYNEFNYMGYQIFIGKNSESNELVTFKIAKKDDLWLHARNFQGSHVVIKKKAAQNFPNPVIEKAASIAAYFSKGKSEEFCPVIVTEKKWVRKIKGAALGKVNFEKEYTILVKPESPF